MDIEKKIYRNACVFKMPNKRVMVGKQEDGGYVIESTILTNDMSRRSLHVTYKDKVVVTGAVYSEEAAFCIYKGLEEMLRKNKVI